MIEKVPVYTYQTRHDVGPEMDSVLGLYASLMSKIVRVLFALAMANNAVRSLKKEFLVRFGITARQFNACCVQVEGKIESVRQLNAQRIKSLKEHIDKLEKRIAKLKQRKRTRVNRWRQQQRLIRLRKKLARLERDHANGKVRICFGTQRLFRSQFNGEQTHEEWKQNWEQQRDREFFTLGSKDEVSGNQTCTATIAKDGSINLRLRLPDSLNQGRYTEIKGLRFAYGHSNIVAAIHECHLRADLARQGDASYKKHGQAICWRFVRDNKGWRIFATTALPQQKSITDRRFGTVGIDINSDHLAVVETDHHGNPVFRKSIPLSLYGKTTNQAKAAIGDACASAVEIAALAKKPLVVEQLDFRKKKENLRQLQSRYARMLSSFAYSTILQTLRSRAYRNGVELFDVNPAFTSLLGRIKYAKRYGLTTHQAAALCIARRFHGFSESLPSQSSVPDDKGRHIAFSVPVRNREKHEWQFLKKVAKKLRAALAEHFRVARCQSSDPPNEGRCDEIFSKTVGEIPARESLATLLG